MTLTIAADAINCHELELECVLAVVGGTGAVTLEQRPDAEFAAQITWYRMLT